MADGQTQAVLQQVPHVWFDIIGRIIPGAFLLAGTFELGYAPQIASELKGYLLSGSVIGPGVGLLICAATAWLVGFLLGTLSYFIVWVAGCCWPFKWERDVPAFARNVIKDRFQLGPDSKQRDIFRARDWCLHTLWTKPAGLQIATLASKRDAEALLSRSIAMAGIVLLILDRFPGHRSCSPAIVFLIIVTVLGLLTYRHYRRRSFVTPLDGIASLEPVPINGLLPGPAPTHGQRTDTNSDAH